MGGPRRVMDPGLPIDALPPIDVVVLSHNHYDHLDRPAVKRIASVHPGTTWIVPLGLGTCIRAWGGRDIVELDWWQHTTIGGLQVTATPARHFSGRGLRDRNRSLWCGFAFETEEKRALRRRYGVSPRVRCDRFPMRPFRLRDDSDRRIRSSLVHADRAPGP